MSTHTNNREQQGPGRRFRPPSTCPQIIPESTRMTHKNRVALVSLAQNLNVSRTSRPRAVILSPPPHAHRRNLVIGATTNAQMHPPDAFHAGDECRGPGILRTSFHTGRSLGSMLKLRHVRPVGTGQLATNRGRMQRPHGSCPDCPGRRRDFVVDSGLKVSHVGRSGNRVTGEEFACCDASTALCFFTIPCIFSAQF